MIMEYLGMLFSALKELVISIRFIVRLELQREEVISIVADR